MTNAEKFKEVFPNVEVNESQKGFVVLHFKTKFNGYEYQESLAVWNSTWLADYQGEPTIPLSVIEKMHNAVDNADCDARLEDENGSYTEEVFTREHIHEIISKVVKECTHEQTDSD